MKPMNNMNLKLIVIVATVLVFGTAEGLKCRSGFNTSAFSIPINFWNESYSCPSGSTQSCFIGQIKYNEALLGQELDITYGSCVSEAYAPLLSCESVFGPDQINVDTIVNAIPDLSQHLQGVVGNLSVDLSKRIQMYFQNSSHNLNRTEILMKVLNEFNISIPENIHRILVKLDHLVEIASANNMTLIDAALKELLSSLGGLNTTHPVTDQISQILETMNITIPDHFKPILEHLPGFIAQYFNISMGTTGDALVQIITKLNISDPVGSLEDIIDMVTPMLPPQLNSLLPVMKSLPELVNQLMQGNTNYLVTWHIQLLKQYSRITLATQAVSNSIYSVLQVYGLDGNLTQDMRDLIDYQPGILYAYFPGNESFVDQVLYNISSAIDSAMSSGGMDIQMLLNLLEMDAEKFAQYMPLFQKLYQGFMTGNSTIIAQVALEALKNVSVTSQESRALSEAIINFVEQFNVTLSQEIKEVIVYFPGLINVIFSNNTDMVNMVFVQITQQLNNMNATQMNYADMINSLIMMSNADLPPGTLALLEKLPQLITAIAMNDTMQAGKLLTQWLIATVGNETEASKQLTAAIIELASQVPGVTVDSSTEMLISYLLRLPYTYFTNNTAMIDMIYANITMGIMNVNTSAFDPASLQAILQNVDLSMLPPQLVPLLNNTDKIIMAIMGNNSAVDIILALAPSYCQSNSITSDFAQAQLENLKNWGVAVPQEVELALECLPGIAYNFFPNQTEMLDAIFSQITHGTRNFTAYIEGLFIQYNISMNPQLTVLLQNLPNIQQALASGNATEIGMVFQQLGMQLAMVPPDLSLIPPSLVPLINSTEGIITAIVTNDTNALMQILLTLTPQYCMSNDVTTAFADALYNELINRGLMIAPELKPLFECVPGILYSFLPNQTDALNMIFTQITQASVNLTSYVEETLGQFNVSLPSQLLVLLQNLPQIQDALATGNTTTIAMVFQQIGMQLAMLPPDLSMLPSYLGPLVNSTEKIITAILTNDTATLIQTLLSLSTQYCASNDVTIAFAEALYNDLMNWGVDIPAEFKPTLQCIPGIFYMYFPNNTETLDEIFTQITQANTNFTAYVEGMLAMVNMSVPPQLAILLQSLPSIQSAVASGNSTVIGIIFQTLGMNLANAPPDLSLLPSELVPLVNSTNDIVNAILTNDTAALIMILESLYPQYCVQNEVTALFADAFVQGLAMSGVILGEELKPLAACIPGALYKFMPNQSAILTTVFQEIIKASNNLTAYVEEQFELINQPVPPELLVTLNTLPDLRMALAEGNMTKFFMILQQLGAETARETELSKLVETLLISSGVNVTEEIRIMIQQNSMSLYYGFPNSTETLDTLFATLNENLMAGEDLGTAIIEAFTEADVPLPPEIIPLLENLQAILDAFLSLDQLAIYDATIQTLEAYNEVYPSLQLELQINIQKLQRTLMVVIVDNTTVPPEVYMYIGNIYNIVLNMSGVTQEEFKQMLTTYFPQLSQMIEFLFLLEPAEVIALGQNFTMWLLDPNRNATTLVPSINATLHIIIDKLDLNIGEILKDLLQPDYCKYNYCGSDKCNIHTILDNATVVTPEPDALTSTTTIDPMMTSTTPKLITTSRAGATTSAGTATVGTGNPNPVTTTQPESTTSGSGIVAKTATTPMFYIISLFFSIKLLI